MLCVPSDSLTVNVFSGGKSRIFTKLRKWLGTSQVGNCPCRNLTVINQHSSMSTSFRRGKSHRTSGASLWRLGLNLGSMESPGRDPTAAHVGGRLFRILALSGHLCLLHR
jgi:hypothetical protein